jgi:signal transduction histidine kinase
MLHINNWNIRARLVLAFVGIVIPYLFLAGIGVIGLQVIWQRVQAIENEAAMELEGIASLQLAVARLVMPANDYLITGDPMERVEFEQRATQAHASLVRAEAIVFSNQEERGLFGAVRDQVPQIEALSREILATPDPRMNRAAPAKMKALNRVSDEASATLGRIREIALREIEEDVERGSAVVRRVSAAGVAALLLSVAGGMGLALIFSTWLSRPIRAIAQGSRRLAEGDLSQRVDINSGGELGEAAQAFNEMAQRLERSAIENAALYGAARWRAERIAAVNRLTKIISASFDIGAVYETFAAELKRFISYTRMGIVISGDSGTQFKLFQLVGNRLNEVPLGMVWSDGKGTGVEWVIFNGRPHFEQDLAKARRFVEDGALLKEGIRSTVRLPLIATGQVIGVLFLDDVEPGRYSEHDLELLVPLGEQLAIAIENARLHGEMERKVQERTRTLQETQAQLIQSGKLAAVGTLAAGVAHELNQPLMIIRGYAQELLRDRRIADEEVRNDLWRIEAQTNRMAAIINHLRDFSRESKGRRQITDLNRMVQDTLAFLEQQLRAGNITVTQELYAALPAVRVDPLRIEQVLLNLITNARDAMEKAGVGSITVRTERTQDSRVALSVTDTGPGIPDEIRTRIFDPFFTTKEVGKGTGLGLSICHGIVEEHGGELMMESPAIDGKGARFTIVLPQAGRDDNTGDRT